MDSRSVTSFPGRIRLHLPSLCRKQKLAQASVAWLEAQQGVKRARLNFACATLVIEYDPSFEGVLRATLGRLSLMSFDDLSILFDPANNKPAVRRPAPLPQPAAHPPLWRRTPLALPTLSLLMAFSTNPVIAAINMPLMLWNAYPIALRAWRVIRRERRLNVDFLDTLAIAASLMQGSPMAGAIVTWLIKLGDWIRDLTAAGQRKAMSELLEFQTKSAWVIRDNIIVSIPTAQLVVGDEVVVYPGEIIPVDGEIIDSHAMIDQKTITGEGLPIMRTKGEAVFAATVVRDGQLTARAIRVGNFTTAGQIARLVESAPIGDTRMQNHAEKFADRLVAPTLGLAVGTAALTGDFQRFLSLVIVDYGTGIRVAAPTSVLASMTHAARAGIIIKSGAHMEASRPGRHHDFRQDRHTDPRLAGGARRDQLRTRHHRSTSAGARGGGGDAPATSGRRGVARQGPRTRRQCAVLRRDQIIASASASRDRSTAIICMSGNERLMRQSDINIRAAEADRAALDSQGYSCIYVAVDGTLAGLLPFTGHQIRPEKAGKIIERLRAMGIRKQRHAYRR